MHHSLSLCLSYHHASQFLPPAVILCRAKNLTSLITSCHVLSRFLLLLVSSHGNGLMSSQQHRPPFTPASYHDHWQLRPQEIISFHSPSSPSSLSCASLCITNKQYSLSGLLPPTLPGVWPKLHVTPSTTFCLGLARFLLLPGSSLFTVMIYCLAESTGYLSLLFLLQSCIPSLRVNITHLFFLRHATPPHDPESASPPVKQTRR